MSLTTQLLADASVNKGGPGSGPQSRKGNKLSYSTASKTAERLGADAFKAGTPRAHRSASAAHMAAARTAPNEVLEHSHLNQATIHQSEQQRLTAAKQKK